MYGAVDIGGTKTLVAVFDAAGTAVEKIKFPTPHEYDAFLQELAATADKLSHHDFTAVGMAIPGSIDRERGIGIRFGNLPWENVPLQADAERIFHAPVVVENDAKLAALSEALLRPEYQTALYITISTGIGTGVVVDGELSPEFLHMESGQMILEHDGSHQMWERFASGSAIVRRYGKRASEIDDPEIWKILSRDFASGMLALFAIVQPDVVIIGGGVGSHFDKFGKYLVSELKKYENPLVPIPHIEQARNAEEAVIYGCFALARKRHAA